MSGMVVCEHGVLEPLETSAATDPEASNTGPPRSPEHACDWLEEKPGLHGGTWPKHTSVPMTEDGHKLVSAALDC
jgi:hypothetical protein